MKLIANKKARNTAEFEDCLFFYFAKKIKLMILQNPCHVNLVYKNCIIVYVNLYVALAYFWRVTQDLFFHIFDQIFYVLLKRLHPLLIYAKIFLFNQNS